MKSPVTKPDKVIEPGQTAPVVIPPAEPVGGLPSNIMDAASNQPQNNEPNGAGGSDSKQLTSDPSLNNADDQTNDNATSGAGDNGSDNQMTSDVPLNGEDTHILIVTASSSRRRIGRRFPAGVPVEISADELSEAEIKELMTDPVLNLTTIGM